MQFKKFLIAKAGTPTVLVTMTAKAANMPMTVRDAWDRHLIEIITFLPRVRFSCIQLESIIYKKP
jgi:hypothetical protein